MIGPLSASYDVVVEGLRVTTQNSATGTTTPLEVSFDNTTPLKTVTGGYLHAHITAPTAGVQVYTGVGVLKAVIINNIGAGVTVTLYDGTSTSGTEIGVIGGTLTVETLTYNATFNTGLFIVVAATTAPDLTITYE